MASDSEPKSWRAEAVMLILIVVRLLYIVYSNQSLFASRFNPKQAAKQYETSQWQKSQNDATDKLLNEWAVSKGYMGWSDYEDIVGNKTKSAEQRAKIVAERKKMGISDSTLYSYVGFKYVNGTSPELLNPEHPPLAKYLVGLSILRFGNVYVGSLITAIVVLILVSVFVITQTGSVAAGLLSACIVSYFSLFADQILHAPQLELFQLAFFLLFLLSHVFWLRTGNMGFYALTAIALGSTLATKTVIPFTVVFSLYLFFTHLAIMRGKVRIAFITSLVIMTVSLCVFAFWYFPYFARGGNLRSFLGLQKYIFLFYSSSAIPVFEFMGNYLRLILTGYWKFWDTAKSLSFYSGWGISWPLLFLVGIDSMKQWGSKFLPITIFLTVYNVFLFITPMFPRYLLMLYVPLIMLIVMSRTGESE